MNKNMEHFKGKNGSKIMSFNEHSMTDNEELNELSILKSPVTLFALLGTYKLKISNARSVEDKLDKLATMLFISGQLNFNLVKGVEDRMKEVEKQLMRLKA